MRWLVGDQLGTPRMAADRTGSLAGVTRHDYLPFGEEVPGDQTWRTPARGYVGDSVRQKFTKKERDADTNLDFFEARYYSSTMGRFTSPDEFTGGPTELFADVAAHNPTFYADLPEPQSLNKYHYALNNPLRYVDPDGHQTTMADKIAECINPPRMWVGNVKAAANVLIDVSNFTAGFIGGEKHERFEPKTCAEGVGMITADRGTLFLSLMGGNPAGVLTAEGETTARVAAEVEGVASAEGAAAAGSGRAGRQARLRELANDVKESSANRGWIRQEMNQMERGKRTSIRNPPGKQLAHERGREAAKGYGYEHSHLQDTDLHKRQHKYDAYGRKNKERPVN